MKSKGIISKETFFFLSTPALMWQIIFLYLPLVALILYSFLASDYSFTLQHYLDFAKPVYLKIILQTVLLASLTSFCCLILAYPVAYFLAVKLDKKFRTLSLFSLIIPSWTSLVVQVYAWFFLLEKNGYFTTLLTKLGLVAPGAFLLNTFFSILVGMISIYLPFMILPLYTVLEKMDPKLLEASADLGASRFQTFFHITLPFSWPGIYTGAFLVFIPCLGEFAIPTLLGGSKSEYWGTIVVQKFILSRDIQAGGAFVVIGIAIFSMITLLGYLLAKTWQLYRSRVKRNHHA